MGTCPHILPYQLPSEVKLYSQEVTDVRTVTSSSSMASSPSPDDSPSALPDVSLVEVSLPNLASPLTTNLNSYGIYNNYLFWQDPMTGHLSLVPVKVRAPQSLHGLDINSALVPQSLRGLITGQRRNEDLFIDSVSVRVRPGNHDQFYCRNGSVISDNFLDHSSHQVYDGQTESKTKGEKECASRIHHALQDVFDLLKGHFSTNGCLDNGCQDIIMGMYTLEGTNQSNFMVRKSNK